MVPIRWKALKHPMKGTSKTKEPLSLVQQNLGLLLRGIIMGLGISRELLSRVS